MTQQAITLTLLWSLVAGFGVFALLSFMRGRK
jgi:hypothetical protein